MDTKSKKIAFLQKLEHPTISAEQIVHLLCPMLKNGADIYSLLVKVNANKLTSQLSIDDVNKFYKELYICWHKSFSKFSKENTSEGILEISKSYFTPELQPENISEEEARKFFEDATNKIFLHQILPTSVANNRKIFGNGHLNNLFLHVKPDATKQFFYDTTCRLYINISPQNALKLGAKLQSVCRKENIPLYYKIWTKSNDRNDNFLVYTTYDYVEKIVSNIKKIKQTNPEIFIGAEKANPFLAKVDDCIFFGEEPKNSSFSFTKLRAKSIAEYLDFYGTLSLLKYKDRAVYVSKNGLKPFFEKNGISIDYPFLNLESAKELEQENEKTKE